MKTSGQQKVCITIPVYKNLDKLSLDELASITQCFTVLGDKYDIFLVCPEQLNIADYKNYISLLGDFPVENEYFDDYYFKDIEGYNSLMMGVAFYDRFSHYEYLLIYQLDCWVFKDELLEWCEQGLDYIGAPLFNNYGPFEEGTEITVVGNGGFSLRKISKFIEVLTWKKNIKGIRKLFCEYKACKSLKGFLLLILKSVGYHNTVRYLLNFYRKNKINEDIFYSYHFAAGSNISINVPSIETAIKFSFDRFPQYIFKLNNNHLPFGCHGWSRVDGVYFGEDKGFWGKYINKQH